MLKKQEIKTTTAQKTHDGSNIGSKEQVGDLGIMMTTFSLHITNFVQKARDKMGFLFRVFQSRERSLMLTLLKSLVIPLLEYCCQLYNPQKAKTHTLSEPYNERLHTKSRK